MGMNKVRVEKEMGRKVIQDSSGCQVVTFKRDSETDPDFARSPSLLSPGRPSFTRVSVCALRVRSYS